MRVALKNGLIVEAQSGDKASMDALRRNNPDADTFTVMADDEVMRRLAEQNDALPRQKSEFELLKERVTALEKAR